MASNPLFSLEGKVALVTGGNGGLGLAMALGLAEAGADVAVAARDPAKTARAAAQVQERGVKVLGLTVDVTREADVNDMVVRVVQDLGAVDILVNNAGTVVRKEPQDLSRRRVGPDPGRESAGSVPGRQGCLSPHEERAAAARFINIGSMFSIFGGGGSGAPYSASKGGLVQLSKSLAVAWARDNIQSNAILPGWFPTSLTADIPLNQPERYDLISRRIPMGRWGNPDDLKGAAVFLASSASDYVTGAVITVDGGYSVS